MRGLLLLTLLASASSLADIKLEVEGVSGPVRDNVIAFLSLSRYATSGDIEDAIVYRLQQRADSEVAEALEPFGYYQPKVSGTLRQEGNTWISHLEIDPGPPTLLVEAEVRVEGPGESDPVLSQALRDSKLVVGGQLNHPRYDRLKSDLMRRALSRGYLDARYTTSDLLVDPTAHEARAHLVLVTGERYRFGAITIEQSSLKRELMNRYVRFKSGDWFDSGDLLRTQFALDDSAYFGSVEVQPGERDTTALTVPVSIRAVGNKRNKYTIGAGYSTDQQWRMTGTWDNRLLNESGHRFRIDLAIGTNAQTYGFTYTIPVGDPAQEKLEIGASQNYESPGDVHSITSVLHSGLTQVAGRWQYVPSLDFAHTTSQIAGANTIENLIVPGITFALVPRGFMSNVTDQSSIMGATPGTLNVPGGVSTAGADATGFYAEVLGSSGTFHSDVTFLRLQVRDQWVYSFAPKWRLVTRAQAGMTVVHDFAQMPVAYRFFAGGDQSVRGYAYQSLSPVDAQGSKSGGRDLLVLSTEVDRDLRNNLAAAVFIDGGNALNRFGDPLAYGTGVGIRYRLPFLSLGFDVAKPLSNGGGSPRFSINISPVF